MAESRLPIEVELVFEVMPCQNQRVAESPVGSPHSCGYFRKWGTYHSYDYAEDGPPPQPGIVQDSLYVGRQWLVPELLSGCRKSPILSIGINPNLPGWWRGKRNSLNPSFDDFRQYAHYFRYRAVSKLEIPPDKYADFGGGNHDTPHSTFELNVPDGDHGPEIPTRLQPQRMYENYQALLNALAMARGWDGHKLSVGEDLAYGNMVACPSAKWATSNADPQLPVMTTAERDGIVEECFFDRRFFLRQLFQSLPRVIMIFSQSTSRAFISALSDRFTSGNPVPTDSIEVLMEREIRLQFGLANDGTPIGARVIFAPHITGSPAQFAAAVPRIVEQLAEEAERGALKYNPTTKHLRRPEGACVLCPMLELGTCDYQDELVPLSAVPALAANSPMSDLLEERRTQMAMLDAQPVHVDLSSWALDDHRESPGDGSESDSGAVVTDHSESTVPLNVDPIPGVELAAGEIDEDTGPTLILRGRIVTMNANRRVIDDGRLLISRGKIRHVVEAEAPLPSEFVGAIELNTHGTIYPGLIDLHNHFVYNVLPLWVVPKLFTNRGQWPSHQQYKEQVSMPMKQALTKSLVSSEAILRYVEAKALIGGSTTGQGILTPIRGGKSLSYGGMRNVEHTKDPRLPNARTRVPDLSGATAVERFRAALAGPGAFFYHLSEGIDDVARQHFVNLQDHELLAETLVGVHGLALTADDLDIMSAAEAGIVWSPFSNLLLYGQTLSLADVKSSGIRFAIGCDWAPTGSKNLLQELKVARYENQLHGSPFSAAELVAAVTSEPAKLLRWHQHVGSLADGRMADVLVLEGQDGDPYDMLLAATEPDVAMVLIHGIPRYGRHEWMKVLCAPHEHALLETFALGATEQAFYFHSPLSPINHVSLAIATERLEEAMADLPEWAEKAATESIALAALGLEDQIWHIELDNELEVDDPFAPYDAGVLDAELAAPAQMPRSIPLESLSVEGDEYWVRVRQQPNLTDELKADLQTAYGVTPDND